MSRFHQSTQPKKKLTYFWSPLADLLGQVDKFVNALRARFKVVSFILPNVAMSAGTIFIMSGDEIIMHARSFFGPIDPQVPNKDGVFVPAQTLRALIDDI